MNIEKKYSDLIIKYLILLIPLFLISGPLLPEIAIAIIFFLMIPKILKKKIKNFNISFIFGFFFFYILIILGSLFSNHIIFSLKSTLFYLRYLILILSIYYILSNSSNFLAVKYSDEISKR